MRKLGMIISAALLSVPSMVHAETHYVPHVSIGAHGGVAMSRMSFSPSVPQGWLMGPQMGIHATYAEEKIFGLGAELNVTQRGWKETFTDNPDLSYSRTLTCLTLPVMTRITFGTSRFKGVIMLGPEVGVTIGDRISSNFDYAHPGDLLPHTRRVNQMSMKLKNRFDYGITAGAGGEFYVTPRNSVSLDVRFYYGLGNIFPASKADEFGASRSMSLSLTAGYSFRLK